MGLKFVVDTRHRFFMWHIYLLSYFGLVYEVPIPSQRFADLCIFGILNLIVGLSLSGLLSNFPSIGRALAKELSSTLTSARENGPGGVNHIPPSHNAWVVGNEPLVAIDFTGMTDFAKKRLSTTAPGDNLQFFVF
jgi:hypothetical protein